MALPLMLFSCRQDSVTINMEKVGGVYMVPAKVNGLPLKFIFDTGASEVSISMTEAIFMAKNGYLGEEDIKGASFAQLADGTVAENTVVKLRTIEIADLTLHDVSATVVHNLEAPLLLGQTAIKKMGRIEFDDDKLIIHTSGKHASKGRSNKVDKKSQAPLDSLVCLAWEEYESEDYIFAQKHLREARQLALNANITNRNWEIDYIDGRVKGVLATSIDGAWEKEMPLLKSAFHANTGHEDGVAIKYVWLLDIYSLGLAQYYSPDDGKRLGDDDMTYEDEFTDVVSLLMERDKYTAYIRSARYYLNNNNLAKGYCEKAIAIDSTKSEGYQMLGYVFRYSAGDKEQAIKYYEKALALPDADSAYIHLFLAYCYPYRSDEQKNHLKQAAQLGDIDAQNRLKNWGITW